MKQLLFCLSSSFFILCVSGCGEKEVNLPVECHHYVIDSEEISQVVKAAKRDQMVQASSHLSRYRNLSVEQLQASLEKRYRKNGEQNTLNFCLQGQSENGTVRAALEIGDYSQSYQSPL